MRMRRIILSSVACPALQYFSTLSHKWYNFQKNLLSGKCVFWFSLQLWSKTFFILRRNQRDRIKNVYCCWCEVPLYCCWCEVTLYCCWCEVPLYCCWCEVSVFLVRFQRNSPISRHIFKKCSYISNLMKVSRVGDELFPADRQTDMTKLIVSVRSFADAHEDYACRQLLAPNHLINVNEFLRVTRITWKTGVLFNLYWKSKQMIQYCWLAECYLDACWKLAVVNQSC
jgi:hypothetical protein